MSVISIAEAFIKREEGCRLTTYLCPAGKPTIGYGHTGPSILPSMQITLQQAQDLLDGDIQICLNVLKAYAYPLLNENQAAALVDFVFNVGAGNFYSSTLRSLLNQERFTEAAEEFLRWDKAHIDGKLVEVEGLKERRKRERELFLTPVV